MELKELNCEVRNQWLNSMMSVASGGNFFNIRIAWGKSLCHWVSSYEGNKWCSDSWLRLESADELWNESKPHKINVKAGQRDLRAIRQLFTRNYFFKLRAAVRSEADPRRSEGPLLLPASTRDYTLRVLNMTSPNEGPVVSVLQLKITLWESQREKDTWGYSITETGTEILQI